MSLHFWLRGSPNNLENFLKMVSGSYILTLKETKIEYSEPVLYLDVGIWHPLAPISSPSCQEHNLNLLTANFDKLNSLPRPLECLQGNPVSTFLSKTFDPVNDPSLDLIMSWGSSSVSFVVWNPTLFARHVLPRNFKHSNFSSFVR
ncbi:Heat stress transcription factor A-3 [Glycine soja]